MSNRKPPLAARPGPKGNKYTDALRGPSFPGRRRRGPEGGTRRLLRRATARRANRDAKGEPTPKEEAKKTRHPKAPGSSIFHAPGITYPRSKTSPVRRRS